MKLYILSLFFFFSFLSSNSQKNIRLDSLYFKIKDFRKKNDNKEALKYLEILRLRSNLEKELGYTAFAYSKIAEIHRKWGNVDIAYINYNKAKEIYFSKKDSIQTGKMLLNIAIIESNHGDYSNSDKNLLKAIQFIKDKKKSTLISCYNSLAINSKKQIFYEEAIYYYKKALELTPSNRQRKFILNNQSNIYKEKGDYIQSIKVLRNLSKDSISNKKNKARIIDNLAYIEFLKDSTSNQIDSLLLAKSIREKISDNYGLIASNSHLSDYYYKKDKNKSLAYAVEMYKVAKNQNSVYDVLEAIDKITSFPDKNNIIAYLKEGIHLRDSLQGANQVKQNKFAKIKYNYEEEEKQKLVYQALATENLLAAEKQKNLRNTLGYLFIISFGLGVFYFYRRRQIYNRKVLETKYKTKYKTETEIAKRLHDDQSNSLYRVISMIQDESPKKDILKGLGKIYNKTREISHEIDTVETGVHFKAYLKQLFDAFNSDSCKLILRNIETLPLNEISEQKQVALYRVFNELLVNMKKHSQANFATISGNLENRTIILQYKDDGKGFVFSKNKGTGIKNMENRIKAIKGTITFDTKPNEGVFVEISIKK